MAIDPSKFKARLTHNAPTTYYGMAYDSATNRVYAGGEDNLIYVYDIAAPKFEPIAKWTKHDNYVSCLVAITRAGEKIVVSGGYDKMLMWWNAEKGEHIRTVAAHDGWIRDLVATPDGSKVISCGDDMCVKVWETSSGKLLATFKGHAMQTPQGHVTALYALAISADGKLIASGDRIGDVRIWSLEDGKQIASLQVPTAYTYDPRQRKRSLGGIRSVSFSRDGQLLAVGGMGQVDNVDGLAGKTHIEIWDWKKPQLRAATTAENHTGMISALEYHPKDDFFVGSGGGGDNAFLAFWPTTGLPEKFDLAKDKKESIKSTRLKSEGYFWRLAIHPNGNEVVTAGHRKLIVWTLA